MQTKLVKVTPAMAEKWLAKRSDRQRPIRDRVVERYMLDMQSGNWKTQHQGLAFGTNGEILDGQHRLEALVKAGLTLPMLVSTNVSADAFLTMDQGAMRTIGNQLGQDNKWVGIVTHLYRLQTNTIRNGTPMSVALVQKVYDDNRDAVDLAYSFITPRMVPAVAAACLAYAYPLGKKAIKDCGKRLRDGEMLKSGDPELAWRKWYANRPRTMRKEVSNAACNVMKAVLTDEDLVKINPGHAGYKYLTTKRRVHNIPNTPTSDEVPSDSR